MPKDVLLLTLRTFSAIGGIEKVCKIVCKALSEQFGNRFLLYSLYDLPKQVESKYLVDGNFKGFNNEKFSFIKSVLFESRKCNVVILSHINLLSVGFLVKFFRPNSKLVLFAHGIEVWHRLSFLRSIMIKKCDAIICVSHFTKNKLVELNQVNEKKLHVLNNCLDPFLQQPVKKSCRSELRKKYGIGQDDIVIMTLARLSSKELYKGYDSVLLSLNKLKSAYTNLRYLMVGGYDEMEKKRLDGIIESLSLQENVKITGYVPDELLAEYFGLADLYIMPSKKEGFGIVFIEAMHFRLPVIAGNKDGSVDALLGGRLGLLVNPDDQQEIDKTLEKLIREKDHYLPDQQLLESHFGFDAYKSSLSNIINSTMQSA